MKRRLTRWLADPALRDHSLGSPEWFRAQESLIRLKPLIRARYQDWYARHLADADSVERPGVIVELGSGGSFLRELRADVIATDIAPGRVNLVCDARALPFASGSVRAILMAHVFHHIPDVRQFLREAGRVLVPGGVVSIIDCAHTPFGRFFFSSIHPEPYRPAAREWSFPSTGNLLDSNQALTWIVFRRDRAQFQREFPGFRIEGPQLLDWFTWLASGGVNLRSFVPQRFAPFWFRVDKALRPLDNVFAIHWHWRLRKIASAPLGSLP